MGVITSAQREKLLRSDLANTTPAFTNGYTARRRPVTLVFAQHFDTITDAIAAERQVKGWVTREERSTDCRKLRTRCRVSEATATAYLRDLTEFASFETAAARPPLDEVVGKDFAETGPLTSSC
jgi:hypothetical protein